MWTINKWDFRGFVKVREWKEKKQQMESLGMREEDEAGEREQKKSKGKFS